MNDDERPDAHLRAALRHAPDAALQAPRELSARILAAARAALEADRPPPWWRRLFTLPPLQVGASGAFATLVLAGVVGLLWRGEPPGPATEPSDRAIAPVPSEAASTLPPAPAAPPQAPVAAERAAAAGPADVSRQREAAKAGQRGAPPARLEPAPPPAAPRAPAGTLQADEAPRHKLAEPAVAAAPPPPPAPAVVAPAPAPAPAPAAAAPAVDAQRALAKSAAEPRADDRAARFEAGNSARQLLPSTAARKAATPATWRLDGGAPSALDAGWLDELQRIAGTRWQPASPQPAAPETRRIEFGEGAALTQILLGPAQVLWCDNGGMAMQCRSAGLAEAEARRLLEMLPPAPAAR